MTNSAPRIAVVIPSYKVTRHILGVIAGIGPEVGRIYVVDDKCPDQSGAYVRAHCSDPRVVVLEHAENQGVGGAVMSGYQAAIQDGVDIIVKVDGGAEFRKTKASAAATRLMASSSPRLIGRPLPTTSRPEPAAAMR